MRSYAFNVDNKWTKQSIQFTKQGKKKGPLNHVSAGQRPFSLVGLTGFEPATP